MNISHHNLQHLLRSTFWLNFEPAHYVIVRITHSFRNPPRIFQRTGFPSCAKVNHAKEDRLEHRNEFSDLNCDTKLFPYRVEGPFETPIPTLEDILAAWEVSKHTTKRHTPTKVWRVGAYMVKVGTTIEVLQVNSKSLTPQNELV